MAYQDVLHISFGKHASARGKLLVHTFIDHGHYVSYAPSLELTAYGSSKEEAIDRLFKEVVNDFLTELTSSDPETALKELKKLGWEQNKLFKRRFISDSFVDKEGILKNFNLPQETEIETQVIDV